MTPAEFINRCEAIGLNTRGQQAKAFNRSRQRIIIWLAKGFPDYVEAKLQLLERESKAS